MFWHKSKQKTDYTDYGEWPHYDPNRRNEIPEEIIDKAQKTPASEKYTKKVLRLFYSNYPEKPYVSKDRELYTIWLKIMTDKSSPMKYKLVDKKMMQRYSDGLLPGHIIMLDWLQHPRKKVPTYFEYEYGINFEKEYSFLKSRRYLNQDGGLTEAGQAVIEKHYEVIKKRHPAPLNTGSEDNGIVTFNDHGRSFSNLTVGKFNIPKSDFALISDEIEEIRDAVDKAKKLVKSESSQNIVFKQIDFKNSYYEYHPISGSRKSKYPLSLHFYSDAYNIWNDGKGNPDIYFGTINYLQNGKIGDARLIFWKKKNGIQINIRTTKNVTYIHDVQTVNASSGEKWKFLYRIK